MSAAAAPGTRKRAKPAAAAAAAEDPRKQYAVLLEHIGSPKLQTWSRQTLERAVGWADAAARGAQSDGASRHHLLHALMLSPFITDDLHAAAPAFYTDQTRLDADVKARGDALRKLDHVHLVCEAYGMSLEDLVARMNESARDGGVTGAHATTASTPSSAAASKTRA